MNDNCNKDVLGRILALKRWIEDAANAARSTVSSDTVLGEDFILTSYAKPQGVLKHQRKLRPSEDFFMCARIDFATFDLRSIFWEERGVRKDVDDSVEDNKSEAMFEGNAQNAVEVLSVYSGLESFLSPESRLSDVQLGELLLSAGEFFYYMGVKNNLERNYKKGWEKEDAVALQKMAGALIVILAYQTLEKALSFKFGLSEFAKGVLYECADQWHRSETEREIPLKMTSSVYLGREVVFNDQLQMLFESEHVFYGKGAEEESDIGEGDEDDEGDGGQSQ